MVEKIITLQEGESVTIGGRKVYFKDAYLFQTPPYQRDVVFAIYVSVDVWEYMWETPPVPTGSKYVYPDLHLRQWVAVGGEAAQRFYVDILAFRYEFPNITVTLKLTYSDAAVQPPPCTPNWVCEPWEEGKPWEQAGGFEIDGCGNRRYNRRCIPASPPTIPCPPSLSGMPQPPGCEPVVQPPVVQPPVPPVQPPIPPIPPVPPVQPIDSGLVIAAVVIIIVLYLIFSEK